MKELIHSSLGNDDRNISSSDVSPLRESSSESHLNELRKSHLIGAGQSPREWGDQQARTNEASSSKSDWESMRWVDSNDKLLLLADRCAQYKDYEKEKTCYQYIIDNFERKPDPDDPTMPQALNGLAKIFQREKRHTDAESLYKMNIDYWAHKPQTDDLDFAPALKGVAKAWMEQGEDSRAEVVYKSVLSIYKEKFGKDDPRTTGALKDLAKIYQKQKKYDKAKAVFEYIHSIYKEKFGEDDPRTKKVLQNLTDLPKKAGKVDKSESIKKLMDKDLPNNLLAYIKYHGRFPDFRDPVTISEKVLHRNFFDRRPMHSTFTDRLEVRKYVTDKIGSQYLPEILHVTDDPSTIPFETLPDKFVIKSTEGSGRVIVVTDKSKIDEPEVINKCQKWLDPDNVYYNKVGAKTHKYSDRKIIVEGFIDDGSGLPPSDYKIFTYDGVPFSVQVDRHHDEKSHVVDMYDGERLEPVRKPQGFNPGG